MGEDRCRVLVTLNLAIRAAATHLGFWVLKAFFYSLFGTARICFVYILVGRSVDGSLGRRGLLCK